MDCQRCSTLSCLHAGETHASAHGELGQGMLRRGLGVAGAEGASPLVCIKQHEPAHGLWSGSVHGEKGVSDSAAEVCIPGVISVCYTCSVENRCLVNWPLAYFEAFDFLCPQQTNFK